LVKKTRSKCLGCYFYESNIWDGSFAKRVVWGGKSTIFSIFGCPCVQKNWVYFQCSLEIFGSMRRETDGRPESVVMAAGNSFRVRACMYNPSPYPVSNDVCYTKTKKHPQMGSMLAWHGPVVRGRVDERDSIPRLHLRDSTPRSDPARRAYSSLRANGLSLRAKGMFGRVVLGSATLDLGHGQPQPGDFGPPLPVWCHRLTQPRRPQIVFGGTWELSHKANRHQLPSWGGVWWPT
jgi:hypothetical protein